jgi:dephospho-CoA kinase
MKIIGITGPSGSGKSLLCRSLEKNRIFCIDADKVYHSLLIPPSECLDAIKVAFGESVFAYDGTLDRAALGAVVFGDEKKLELLNKTVLSRVIARIREIIAEHADIGEEIVAVDAPTLIESGFDKECDIVVSVIAPTDARKKRIIERDAISEQRAQARIGAQKSDAFYREHSDMVIENSGTLEQFEQKISDFMAQLRAGGLI